MAMTTCKECGADISTKADACPKCGAKVRRTGCAAWGCLAVLVGFVGLSTIGVLVDSGSSPSGPPVSTSPTSRGTSPAGGSGAGSLSNLTPAQRNGVRSANSYLEMSGFSRQGLIDQLSSEYGDQYSVQDATIAVDNLSVDWNEQAARSAESYLEMSGFSCQGLIEQLSSDYGDQYTVEQARYGATRAGIC